MKNTFVGSFPGHEVAGGKSGARIGVSIGCWVDSDFRPTWYGCMGADGGQGTNASAPVGGPSRLRSWR